MSGAPAAGTITAARPTVEAAPAGAPAAPKRPRVFWPELDVIRGIAAVTMIFSHVGAGLFGNAEQTFSDATGLPTGSALLQLCWYGGVAPVLFFFVTGLGYGVKGPVTPGRSGSCWRGQGFGDVVTKAAILFAADALMWLPGRHAFGLDFFGFIGLSMLVLWVIRALPLSVFFAVALAGGVMALRFAFAPLAMRALGPEHADTVAQLDRLFGNDQIDSVSFNPGPWLVIPLAGFVLGRGLAWLQQRGAARGSGAWRMPTAVVLTVLGGAGVVGSYFFSANGGTHFYRFGVLSLPYLVGGTALCVLLLGVLLARYGQGADRLGRVGGLGWLSLRGIAAFLVVPLHFMAIHLWRGVRGGPIDAPGPWDVEAWAWMLLLPVLCLWAAPKLAEVYRHVCGPDRKRPERWTVVSTPALLWSMWVAVVVATAALGVVLYQTGDRGWVTIVARSVGQLALCGLLILPLPGTAAARRARRTPAAGATAGTPQPPLQETGSTAVAARGSAG